MNVALTYMQQNLNDIENDIENLLIVKRYRFLFFLSRNTFKIPIRGCNFKWFFVIVNC
jgi:hypothetical protein